MSTTFKNNDIYITRRDTLSTTIKENDIDKVFLITDRITMFVWENADMQTVILEKTFTPNQDGLINLYLTPTENDLEYTKYYYSLLQTKTDDVNFRETLIPESGETCDTPKYVICRGDGNVGN